MRFGDGDGMGDMVMKVSELLSKATPQPVTRCRCTHEFIRHEGDTGGHCMDCGCLEFTECANAKL